MSPSRSPIRASASAERSDGSIGPVTTVREAFVPVHRLFRDPPFGTVHGDMATTRFRRTVAVGGIAAATLVLATAYAAVRIHHAHRTWAETATANAYVSTSAFAEAAESWLQRHQQDTLRRVVDVMVSGPYRYIELIVEGEAVLAAGDTGALQRDLVPPSPGAQHEVRTSLERRGSRWMLDVWVPFASLNGYVRTAQDVTASRAAMIGEGLRTAAVSFGAWSLLSALVWALGRRIERRRGEEAVEPATPSELRIDARTKSVDLNGRRVRLSPKQFSLLTLLSSEEGKIFSDDDILSAIWPESPYADSNDIRQCVYQLRRRLEAAQPGGALHVYNEKGFGYSFVPNLPSDTPRPQRPPAGKEERHDALDAP